MNRRVLAAKNARPSMPIIITVLYPTALSYWQAPEWLWGVTGVLLVLAWAFCIWDASTATEVELP